MTKDYAKMNKYLRAYHIRGEITDMMFNDEVITTMDIKYNHRVVTGNELHHEDLNMINECTDIILEAFDKAVKYDEIIEYREKNEKARKMMQTDWSC
jgi:hypothetical protein